MRNKTLTEGNRLLDERGVPLQYGYSKKPMIYTNNKEVNSWRLKEWDFYQISNREFTLQVTYGHASYAGAIGATLFDYKGAYYHLTLPLLFPFRSLSLAPSAGDSCDLKKESKNYKAEISVRPGKRTIKMYNKHKNYGDCYIDIALSYPEDEEGVLVVTPFKNPKHFYHNYKQSSMEVSGEIKIGGKTFTLGSESFGLIDWGRGRLPYRHTWWWGNGSCRLGEGRFGFNIGVFGDTTHATENALFFNGKTHKLDDITYKKEGENIIFTSSDRRFEMEFIPTYDNYTELNLLIAHNRCHQLFGNWNGTVTLDDGKKLHINDMFAFVEFAENRW